MHTLIVHAHPEPRSFNAALTAIAADTLKRAGHTVQVSDLYAEGFDPSEGPAHYHCHKNPDYFSALAEQQHAGDMGSRPFAISREIDRLETAELVIFQFPMWWHSAPALLKGWLDRVFVYGDLYTGRMRYDHGYFRGRRALVSVTTGAPASVFTSGGRGGGTVESLLHPLLFSLHYMGYGVLPPFCAHGIQGGGKDVTYWAAEQFTAQLESHKMDWARCLENLEKTSPMLFPGWQDWDKHGVPMVKGTQSISAQPPTANT